MSNTLCSTPLISLNQLNKPGFISHNSVAFRVNDSSRNSNSTRFVSSLQARAANNTVQNQKSNSIVCPDCEGNGAILCSSCKGDGVNTVDHFNGRFKAGGLCWLCRGKRDILCGNCNGAGFVGGFMSTSNE